MKPILYTPIGIVHSPFTAQAGMPIQTVAAQGIAGTIELDPAFAAGLRDVDGFSHLWLVVHLHQIHGYALEVTPYLDDQPHGVFATRSPCRPNPIGLSIVRLIRVEASILYIEDLDLLDGTPVLDIKPYLPLFDQRETDQIGWFSATIQHVQTVRADDRFR
jgi:tRNA-Thr(GGU) m(6)t(6)A37 methyltransferase TsaA